MVKGSSVKRYNVVGGKGSSLKLCNVVAIAVCQCCWKKLLVMQISNVTTFFFLRSGKIFFCVSL